MDQRRIQECLTFGFEASPPDGCLSGSWGRANPTGLRVPCLRDSRFRPEKKIVQGQPMFSRVIVGIPT